MAHGNPAAVSPDEHTHAQWQKVVAALRRKAGVTVVAPAAAGRGRRFGSNSLRVNDKIFAMMASGGRFVLKLPGPRVQEIITAGRGEHFDPTGKRWMKEWVAMAPGSEQDWLVLATEAMNFVAASTSPARGGAG